MRIFIAGASGVIGSRLVPLLVAAGHEVAGMTRSHAKAQTLRALGATPIVCDVYDAPTLKEAVARFRPDTVVHQLTDLPDDAALIPARSGANNRMRRDGTANLLTAARAAGARRLLAQSVAWNLPTAGAEAVEALERTVLGAGGVVLRYGRFYGPGTYYDGSAPPHPRIHVDEAARRTVAALDAPSGVVTVAEDPSPIDDR
ncbi:MAG: NAD-dependent epimerase/dehydratase family protein [Deinococcales bacterium]